jgi:hypothetical protein
MLEFLTMVAIGGSIFCAIGFIVLMNGMHGNKPDAKERKQLAI